MLTPEQIEGAVFTTVKQGYDTTEVHALLRTIAGQLRDGDDFERAGEEVAAALRGMHHLLTEMKQNAENEIAAERRAAEDERTRLLIETNEEVDRLRAKAQAHHDEVVGEAEVKARRMVEEATLLHAEAEQVAEAIDHTVRSKRREIDQYVVSLSARAEELARGRVDEVLNNHRAALSQLAESRNETAETLRRAQRLIDSALGVILTDLDLTTHESPVPQPADDTGLAPLDTLAHEIATDGMAKAQPVVDASGPVGS